MSDTPWYNIKPVIADYLPVLNRMSNSKSNKLIGGIEHMRKYGVNAFASRIIYANGYSSMFCTSVDWAKIDQDEAFCRDFKHHLSSELVKIAKTKATLITRSGDRTDSPFLQRLQNYGVNNSIILHEFHPDKVEIVYFMGAKDNPGARDEIINNLACLNFVRKTIKPALAEVQGSTEFKRKRELILTRTATEAIWGGANNKLTSDYQIFGKYVTLSVRELECLQYLMFGSTNQFIANKLSISVQTVKTITNNLRDKLALTSRQDLIEIAQSQEISNILKAISMIK